jgi:lipopolysaccharide/colanic/teichoic acid biosynthesis glycosyltransferase
MFMVIHSISSAIKRLADLTLSAILLVLSAPLMLICALMIKLDSPGPAFFIQERLGFRGKKIRVVKFRTMVQDAERKGDLVSASDPRITKLGHMLRKFRIDEWPQLINVFFGSMSLVGPRPLVPLHANAWTTEERRRLDVKPGMTGWQQVNGAATNTWEQRVALDLWYVDHWSLWLDLKILFRTPLVVLGAKTVYGKDGVERSAIPTRVLQNQVTSATISIADKPTIDQQSHSESVQ